jgi:non-ribosomal peptide synthetase component F
MFCTPYPPSEPFSYYTSRPQQPRYGYGQCYSPYDAYLEEEQARIAQVKAAKRRAYEAHVRLEILARQQQVSRQREQEKREREAEAERRRAAYQRQLFNHLFGPRQQPEQEQEPADSTHEEEVDDEEEEQYVYSPFQRRNISAPSQKRHTCVSETLHRQDKQQPTASTSYIPISTPQDQQAAQIVEQPKISCEEAVAIVQKYAQRAITIRQKLRALNQVRAGFITQQQAFTLPKR